MSGTKYVYDFEEGNKEMKYLLGGKGANLAEMTNMGLPVPHGFTVTCEACNAYRTAGRTFPEGMLDEVAEHLSSLESKLGDPADPLLVSVRSGAPFSMPGMMDTVLNVGLNDESVEGLAKQTGSQRFAWDSYRRLLQMFGKTVMGVDGDHFEEAIDEAKNAKGVRNDVDLDDGDLRALVDQFKKIIVSQTGREFQPQAWSELQEDMQKLERHYRDMCDIEFTVEQGKLWLLQTRVGKRTAFAEWIMAYDMQDEGLIDVGTALLRLDADRLEELFKKVIASGGEPIATGLNASPGAAVGKAVFAADDAEAWARRGEPVILVRRETTPDDYHGMIRSQGILTSAGGTNSHAAVVARGEGIPAVCGADAI